MKACTCLCTVLLLCSAALTGCRKHAATTKPEPVAGSYDSEADWNDPQHVIPLDYRQAQGKRIFYQYCVWCHADATPAGPSNRSNLQPVAPLLNDGAMLNSENDDYIQNIITLGGSAMGKSAMMPPYGRVLSQEDVRSVIAFTRAIAQPPYQPPGRPGSQYMGK
jgi:mono/diheme cytochrome c family protein